MLITPLRRIRFGRSSALLPFPPAMPWPARITLMATSQKRKRLLPCVKCSLRIFSFQNWFPRYYRHVIGRLSSASGILKRLNMLSLTADESETGSRPWINETLFSFRSRRCLQGSCLLSSASSNSGKHVTDLSLVLIIETRIYARPWKPYMRLVAPLSSSIHLQYPVNPTST